MDAVYIVKNNCCLNLFVFNLTGYNKSVAGLMHYNLKELRLKSKNIILGAYV